MTSRAHTGWGFLILAIGLAGCSSTPTSAPPPASRATVPTLPAIASITGNVVDTGFRSIPGARVEVVDGVHAGASTTADGAGQFSLSGPFDRATTFRASKDGHVARTQTAVVYCRDDTCYGALAFYLSTLDVPVNINGDYTLTFVADTACADLPDDVRTRTYAATIGPNPGSNVSANTSLSVTLSGAPFLGNYRGFEIGVAGDHLGFALNGGESPSVVDQLPGNRYVAFSGSAAATVAPGASTISTPFEGWIEYCATKTAMSSIYGCGISTRTGQPIPGEVVTQAVCESKNHQLILTRR